MERNVRDPRIAALPDIHGHAKGEHKPFAEERPIPYTARMLFLWFFHACRRFSPRFIMVSDHMNYLTFEDPAAVNLVRRALKLAQAGDLYGAAETAGVELGHAAVVSEGLRRGMRYSIGAEVDNDPRCRPDAQNIVDAMKPDGMVRSVHFIPIAHPQHGENWLWAFDNSEFKSLYEVVGTEAVWEIYMATLLDAIDKLPGNIIGHFYVPAKFGHWPDDLVLEGYEDRFIDACAQRGMAIEVNSRYFYKYFVDDDAQLAKYRSVHVRLLRKAKAKGVMIAVGSDAHSPKDQGAAFDAVLAVLDEAEVNEIAFPINGHLARVALRATEEILRQHNAALAPAVAERTPLPRSAAAHADAAEKDHGPADDRRDGAVAVAAIVPVSSDDAAAAHLADLGALEEPGAETPAVAGRPRRPRPKPKPKAPEPTASASTGSVASAEPAAVQPALKKRSHKKIVVPAAADAPALESPVAAIASDSPTAAAAMEAERRERAPENLAASSAGESAKTTARETSASPKPGTKKPVVAKPVAPEHAAARPVPAKPIAVKPIAVKPIAARPVAAKPVAAKPIAAKASAAKAAASKPSAMRPAAAKPTAAKPAAAKAVAMKSAAAKAAGAKPVATKATSKTAAKRPAAKVTRTKAMPAARGAAKVKPAKTAAKKAAPPRTAAKRPMKKTTPRSAVQGAKAPLRKTGSVKASVKAAKQTISAKSTARSSGTKKSLAKKTVAKKKNSRR